MKQMSTNAYIQMDLVLWFYQRSNTPLSSHKSHIYPQAMTFITWRYIKDHFQGLAKSPQLGHVSYIKWPANSTKTYYQ